MFTGIKPADIPAPAHAMLRIAEDGFDANCRLQETFRLDAYLIRKIDATIVIMDFEKIYNAYAKQVFRICLGYTNDTEKAKDLVQETFISVWKNLSSFENRSLITTWIFRIATNNCLRHLEVEKRHEKTLLPDNLMEDHSPGQEDKIQFLYKCISELAETDRIIISLDLEELPQAEIASIVGLSHSTIRVRIHRIKDKLKQKFQEHGQFR